MTSLSRPQQIGNALRRRRVHLLHHVFSCSLLVRSNANTHTTRFSSRPWVRRTPSFCVGIVLTKSIAGKRDLGSHSALSAPTQANAHRYGLDNNRRMRREWSCCWVLVGESLVSIKPPTMSLSTAESLSACRSCRCVPLALSVGSSAPDLLPSPPSHHPHRSKAGRCR